MPPEVAVLSNALAIMAFDIDASNREVAFELSWVSNLFDYTDSRNLFLFSATNLQDRQWTPIGEFLLCCCRDSNKIQVFRRNKKTGALSDTGKDIPVSRAVCVQFL